MADTPVFTQQPNYVRQFNNQFNNPQLLNQLAAYNPLVTQALYDLQAQRVNRGSQPYSLNQSLGAAAAAQSGQVLTNPKPGAWYNPVNIAKGAVGDVKDIVTNIPQIPFQLYHEAQQLPQAPGAISESLSKGDIGGVFNAPGVRMVPLTGTLSALLPGGTPAGSLAQHPVLTALDVTPLAEAKILPGSMGKAASLAGEGGELSKAMTSIADNLGGKTATASAATVAGEAMPSRVSLAEAFQASKPAQAAAPYISQGVDALAHTKPGQFLTDAFGPTAREMSGEWNALQRKTPESPQGVLEGMEAPQTPGQVWKTNLQNMVDDSITRRSVTRDQLEAMYRPQADLLAQSPRATLTSDEFLDKLIDRNYTTPGAYGSVHPSVPDGTYIPREVDRTLRQIAKPGGFGQIIGNNPIMKAFRTSVLPLAVRFHINNAVGNAAMLMSETGPGVYKYFGQMKQLMKEGETTLQGKTVTIPEGLRQAAHGYRNLEADFNRAGVNTTFRLYNDIQNSKAAQALSGVADKAGKIVSKGYALNELFDDSHRTLAYLYGYDKALTKGLSAAEASTKGLELANKVMLNLSNMTPIERGLIRNIFPFYGFYQHILRRVLTYPADHPMRAAILANFAKIAEQDHLSGLPDQFDNLFRFGPTDAKGNQRAFDLGGMNPFRNAADYFTFKGLVGNANPLIKLGLEQLGVNPQQGGPDLYPNLQYNAETGQLEYKRPSFLPGLVADVIPQSQALMQLTGHANAFRELSRTNPEAAQRLLRSEVGIPTFFRNVNPTQSIMKSEINAEKAQQTALSEALRTGDPSGLRQWPRALAQYQSIQQQAAQGQINQFLPQTQAPDPLSTAVTSVANNLSTSQ